MPDYNKLLNSLQETYSKNPDIFNKVIGIGTIGGGITGMAIGASTSDSHPFIGSSIGGSLGASTGTLVGTGIAYKIAKNIL